jgi:ABC-type polysaccharide/polyol phosphate export permease
MASGIQVSNKVGFNPWITLTDLRDGAKRVSLWLAFASDEIQQRYRRSRLGLAWIVISYLIFVGAISLFFGNFSDLEHGSFTVYVAINFAIFMFLLGNVTDGCAVFRVAQSWVKSAPLPHSIYVYKSVSRSLFVFAINLVIAIGILFLYGGHLQWVALGAIPAFLLLLVDCVLVQLILGYISTRYPDVEHLTQSIVRILYFTTPVLWVRDEHAAPGLRNTIAEINPFTHALEIFAAPLLGKPADPQSWIFMLAMSGVLLVLAVIVGGASHRRLLYWL